MMMSESLPADYYNTMMMHARDNNALYVGKKRGNRRWKRALKAVVSGTKCKDVPVEIF